MTSKARTLMAVFGLCLVVNLLPLQLIAAASRRMRSLSDGFTQHGGALPNSGTLQCQQVKAAIAELSGIIQSSASEIQRRAASETEVLERSLSSPESSTIV